MLIIILAWSSIQQGWCLAVLMIVNPGFSVFSIGVLMGVYLLLLGIDCLITAFSDIGGGW